MRAKLIRRGKVNIYCLQKNDRCDVESFLEENKNNANMKGIVAGFYVLINRIAEEGYSLQAKLFKCWKEDNSQICEIRKAKHRLSCFKYERGSKLLLVTHFIKYSSVEKKEYNRALNLKKKFDANQIWG